MFAEINNCPRRLTESRIRISLTYPNEPCSEVREHSNIDRPARRVFAGSWRRRLVRAFVGGLVSSACNIALRVRTPLVYPVKAIPSFPVQRPGPCRLAWAEPGPVARL